MSAITTELIVRDDIVFLLPVIPDDAPPLVREGIARRRLVVICGECPCGGRSRRLATTRGQVTDGPGPRAA
jgi:hypothetical protein